MPHYELSFSLFDRTDLIVLELSPATEEECGIQSRVMLHSSVDHHHKHQGLGHLARSVSRVTAVLANVSSVSQLFSFLVDCSGMTLKGFSFVAFFAGVKASSFCIHLSCLLSAKGAHPYRKRACLEALRLATIKPTQQGTGYPS
jgi:hypothetical protein